MPHSRYTHEVIELKDGRCFCLACDEVVPARYLDDRRAGSGAGRPGPGRQSGAGD